DKDLLYEAHSNLATIYARQRNDELLREHLYLAVKAKPKRYQRYFDYIIDTFFKKNYKKSHEDIERLADIVGKKYDIEVMRAKIFIELKQYDLAEAVAISAMKLSKDTSEAEVVLTRIRLYGGDV